MTETRHRKKRRFSKKDNNTLEKIADAALELGRKTISTTFIKGHSSPFFWQHYDRGKGSFNFVRAMKRIKPKKYSGLRASAVHKADWTYSRLSKEEYEIIENTLQPYRGQLKTENLPTNIVENVQEKLREKGYVRSILSAKYHANNIWLGEVRRYKGIPTREVIPKRKPRFTRLRTKIERKLQSLEDKVMDLEGLVEKETNQQKKEEYFNICSRGHQELIAYLMDPRNYRKHIGKELKLIAVDFTKSNTPPELFAKYEEKVRTLEDKARESSEVISFVDNWMRCDMIFQSKTGVYVIVEIKQNAMNHGTVTHPGYPNADKVVEQIGAYTGGLKARIRWKNKSLSLDQKLPENVYGVLAAYYVDPHLKEFLNQNPETKAVVIPKEAVIKAVRLSEPRTRIRRISEQGKRYD